MWTIDGATNSVTAKITGQWGWDLGARTTRIDVNPRTLRVYVSDGAHGPHAANVSLASVVTVIDGNTNAIIANALVGHPGGIEHTVRERTPARGLLFSRLRRLGTQMGHGANVFGQMTSTGAL
ncbi:MAG: hypothetical protein ACXWBQ_19180 [Usitatibacter sp.]